MMLTGKAKEDFYYYVFNNIKEQLFGDLQDVYDYIYSLPISCKHALIIEWFDSVGVYIFIERATYVFKPNFIYRIDVIDDLYEGHSCTTRKEATKQAIIKANQIYNEKFSG